MTHFIAKVTKNSGTTEYARTFPTLDEAIAALDVEFQLPDEARRILRKTGEYSHARCGQMTVSRCGCARPRLHDAADYRCPQCDNTDKLHVGVWATAIGTDGAIVSDPDDLELALESPMSCAHCGFTATVKRFAVDSWITIDLDARLLRELAKRTPREPAPTRSRTLAESAVAAHIAHKSALGAAR